MKSEWQNCPVLEENATAQSVGNNPGQTSKDKAVPKTFPSLPALSLVISLTHLPYDPSSNCRPAMGRRRCASRHSCNCSYQAYILTIKKSHLSPNPAGGPLKLMDLSNWSQVHHPDICIWMIQWWPELRCVQVLPSCYRGTSFAWQKGKRFASSDIITGEKKKKVWKAVLPDSSTNTAFTLRVIMEISAAEQNKPRNMDEMEQALEVEDVLKCHLVPSTATPVGAQVFN